MIFPMSVIIATTYGVTAVSSDFFQKMTLEGTTEMI